MTQLIHLMPEIESRASPKNKPGEGAPRRWSKYDHFQMLMDRKAGMSWADIAIKHGVKAPNPMEGGCRVRQRLTVCKTMLRLSPAEAAGISWRPDGEGSGTGSRNGKPRRDCGPAKIHP